ncbi:helix-turn-helix domain-containing protein [Nocardia sp. NPDC005746]|uniref:MmyB family transcriptional regulator n=1 Tax=unclassified Nocardia TaxID=2637762 RepID=UPI0033E69F97
MLQVNPELDEPRLRPPTFGALLSRLRRARRISRERLAFGIGTSASYIVHLEKGYRTHPGHEVVEAIVRYLDQQSPISSAEQRHLLDLAGLGHTALPTSEELTAAVSPEMRQALVLHEPNPAAYLDIRGTVLACNENYRRAFPGLDIGVNLLHWYLTDDNSRRVLPDLDNEIRFAVQGLRGMLSDNSAADGAREFLAELSRFDIVRKLWDEAPASYGRPDPAMRLRDPETGHEYTINAQLYGVTDDPSYPGSMQFFLGIRPADAPPAESRSSPTPPADRISHPPRELFTPRREPLEHLPGLA